VILFDTYTVPFKVYRYLFNLILPIAFFSLLGVTLIMIKWKKSKKAIIIILLIIFAILFTINFGIATHRMGYRDMYPETADKIENLGLDDCRVLTTLWVPLDYYAGNVYPLMIPIDRALEQNNIVLIFKGITTMDDTFTEEDLEKHEPFFEDDVIMIFGDRETCMKRFDMYDRPHTNEHCRVLSTKFSGFEGLVENVCNIINFDLS